MRPSFRSTAALAGACGVGVVVAGLAIDPTGAIDLLRARVYDGMLTLTAPAPRGTRVVVIDIDEDSLEREGPWPWRRERIAQLIELVRAAGAAAVGVDILFAAPDSQSPAALARRLNEVSGDKRILAPGPDAADDDHLLANALKAGRVALAFALDPYHTADASTAPILARAQLDLTEIWSGPGGVFPIPSLSQAAALGLSSLPGDADGVVRRAPLFAAIGGALKPGLALETVRLARGGLVYVLEASPARATTGDVSIALPRDAMLRLAPLQRGVETISAWRALGQGGAPDLKGAVVFIGASAPEAAGLRATGDRPLTASVTIQARAARQILAGYAPVEADALAMWTVAVALGAALVALPILAPAPLAYGLAVPLLLAPFVFAFGAAKGAWLFDPIEASAPPLVGFAVAAAVVGASQRRRARRLRERFERHLAPAVVQRIVASEAPRLASERREITTLFTDIEDFTGMVSRADPEALVAALDGYFEGLTRIGFAHGGMVDKFVGDAVHIFFNMPFDLADHATKALDCAEEIVRWSEAYRLRPGPAALRFGRTRVGLESGPALVGEVGSGAKLDYTAHGETVNAAARLEQANKIMGTAVCVGPGAAARVASDRLRPIGAFHMRGFSAPVELSAPWPDRASANWRARYIEAWTKRSADRGEAAKAFAALTAELDDPIAARESRG
jgi:adenylate cyclase